METDPINILEFDPESKTFRVVSAILDSPDLSIAKNDPVYVQTIGRVGTVSNLPGHGLFKVPNTVFVGGQREKDGEPIADVKLPIALLPEWTIQFWPNRK